MLIETTEVHIAAGHVYRDVRDWSFDGKLLTITLADWTTIRTNSLFAIVHKKILSCGHDVSKFYTDDAGNATGDAFCHDCHTQI